MRSGELLVKASETLTPAKIDIKAMFKAQIIRYNTISIPTQKGNFTVVYITGCN